MASHILVIDDSDDINQIIKMALQDEGYQVTTYQKGTEAMDFLEQESPDLILLDILLPDVHGLSMLTQIKQDKPHIPVIMITAFASVETAVKAIKDGAEDYICKPFRVDELRQRVKDNLESTKKVKELAPTLEEVERNYIVRTLKQYDGNRRKTAEVLGISLRALYYKIKQYNLE